MSERKTKERTNKPRQRADKPRRNDDWRSDYSHREYYVVRAAQVTPEVVAQTVSRVMDGLVWIAPPRRDGSPNLGKLSCVLKIRKVLGKPAGLDGLPAMTREQVREATDGWLIVDPPPGKKGLRP